MSFVLVQPDFGGGSWNIFFCVRRRHICIASVPLPPAIHCRRQPNLLPLTSYLSPLLPSSQYHPVVDLWLFFDEWSRCISSGYQKDHLYRFGNFDACSAQYADLKIAVTAKAKSDEDEARRLVATTHYRRVRLGSSNEASPTAGIIWDLKEPTGWDVN